MPKIRKPSGRREKGAPRRDKSGSSGASGAERLRLLKLPASGNLTSGSFRVQQLALGQVSEAARLSSARVATSVADLAAAQTQSTTTTAVSSTSRSTAGVEHRVDLLDSASGSQSSVPAPATPLPRGYWGATGGTPRRLRYMHSSSSNDNNTAVDRLVGNVNGSGDRDNKTISSWRILWDL